MKKPVAQFQLNSQDEPTDEQLESLMDAVAEEVRRKKYAGGERLKTALENAVRLAKERHQKA